MEVGNGAHVSGHHSYKTVLFVDVDGVLNLREAIDPAVASSTIHADKIARLNQVLLQSHAAVVLSSAWRYLIHNGSMTLDGIDWLFRSHGLVANRIIGITEPDTMVDGVPVPDERGRQISDWLGHRGPVGRYAVVDDQDLGITAAGHPFVQTQGHIGITNNDAARLIELLRHP